MAGWLALGVSYLPVGQVGEEELRMDEGSRQLEPGCRLSGAEGRCPGGKKGYLLLS